MKKRLKREIKNSEVLDVKHLALTSWMMMMIIQRMEVTKGSEEFMAGDYI